jgi:GNAT superfamily N-acetyltransferase
VEQGRLRESAGGAVAELRDLVAITAGFEAAGVNSGDVMGPDPDLDGARAFYDAHGVTWGLRVPEEMPWAHGRLLFRRRLMGLDRAAFRPTDAAPGLSVRAAGPEDLETALHIDSTAFGLDREENRRWLEPLLSAERVEFALGSLGDLAVGTAYVLRSDGGAGPSAYLAGVAVLPEARRRGVGAGVSSWLLQRAFERGAEIAHLNPDTHAAARIYERLGFTELPGHDIYIEL